MFVFCGLKEDISILVFEKKICGWDGRSLREIIKINLNKRVEGSDFFLLEVFHI